MGIASVLAENERLRLALLARDQALAERDAKIAALTVSNEDLAHRLELIRLNASARRNQRHVEGASPLPLFTFAEPVPPPRLPCMST